MRRALFFSGFTAVVATLVIQVGAAATANNRDVAEDAARWIRSGRVTTPFGYAWASDPRNPKTLSTDLYSGSPGVVLFLLELYEATGDRVYLDEASRGADDLATKIRDADSMGLYEGLSGIGFTLGETWRATKKDQYRRSALAAVKAISDRARRVGRGVQWSNTADIISGSAGTGLFLIYADSVLKAPGALPLAVNAGDRLIELGQPDKGGLKWAMDPEFKRLMPNFSHGTAGISYFLAVLYQSTHEKRFLDAALAGAKYLLAIAKTEGNICLVQHDQPDNLDLYYLGWCHGPVGTARLFYQLYKDTNDQVWMDWVRKSANGILASGIPEQRTPGFWNNVSQCCGDAGVAQFFLDLYNATKDKTYLAFTLRMTADLLDRATQDAQGTRWVQAENRVEPNKVVAQTGYMQGAAGIGMWFLHLDAAENGRKPFVHFPDSPWQ